MAAHFDAGAASSGARPAAERVAHTEGAEAFGKWVNSQGANAEEEWLRARYNGAHCRLPQEWRDRVDDELAAQLVAHLMKLHRHYSRGGKARLERRGLNWLAGRLLPEEDVEES